MVEIGNEDHLGGGCKSHPERITAFYDAIHNAYLGLQILASTNEPDLSPQVSAQGSVGGLPRLQLARRSRGTVQLL